MSVKGYSGKACATIYILGVILCCHATADLCVLCSCNSAATDPEMFLYILCYTNVTEAKMWEEIASQPQTLRDVYLNPAFNIKVPENAFAGWKITNLYIGGFRATAGGGVVQDVEDGAFMKLKLTRLDLSLNDLKTIRRGMFNGLEDSSALYLDLAGNKIEMLDAGLFKGIALEGIDLKNNRIERLSRDVFDAVPAERVLLEGESKTFLFCFD